MSDSEDYARSLLSSGCCITLYWRESVFDEALKELHHNEFDVYDFECSQWEDEADFHDAVADKMSFPDYYGRNLDAFNDSFGDAIITEKSGVVVAFRHYDHFHKRNEVVSKIILDIFQSNAWHCLLDGKLLVVLMQSDDARFLDFEKIGAVNPDWNRDEWMNKDRGL